MNCLTQCCQFIIEVRFIEGRNIIPGQNNVKICRFSKGTLSSQLIPFTSLKAKCALESNIKWK